MAVVQPIPCSLGKEQSQCSQCCAARAEHMSAAWQATARSTVAGLCVPSGLCSLPGRPHLSESLGTDGFKLLLPPP